MLLSFIMPAYKKMYLKQAIKSIIMQTDGSWELVVVDDCSPEDLYDVVSSFNDPRIRYYRNEKNIGGKDLVAQWNHSISYAKGEWIVLAGDDDVYQPEFCSSVQKLAEKHPEIDLIRARVGIIDGNGNHLWNDRTFPEYFSCYEYLNRWLSGELFTCVGNYAFRKTALAEIGGFASCPYAFCSDQQTPIMLSKKGVANTAGLLFNFRQSDIHLSGNKSLMKEKLEAMMSFYQWLGQFDFPSPVSDKDISFYSIKNSEYLHKKCIYDCFNHAIRFVPLSDLPKCLRMCRPASKWEKIMMFARWIKRRLL